MLEPQLKFIGPFAVQESGYGTDAKCRRVVQMDAFGTKADLPPTGLFGRS